MLRLSIVCVAFNLSVHSIFRRGNELLTIHGRRQMTGWSWPRNLKSLGCHDYSAETTRVCALLEICVRAEFRGLRQQRNWPTRVIVPRFAALDSRVCGSRCADWPRVYQHFWHFYSYTTFDRIQIGASAITTRPSRVNIDAQILATIRNRPTSNAPSRSPFVSWILFSFLMHSENKKG